MRDGYPTRTVIMVGNLIGVGLGFPPSPGVGRPTTMACGSSLEDAGTGGRTTAASVAGEGFTEAAVLGVMVVRASSPVAQLTAGWAGTCQALRDAQTTRDPIDRWGMPAHPTDGVGTNAEISQAGGRWAAMAQAMAGREEVLPAGRGPTTGSASPAPAHTPADEVNPDSRLRAAGGKAMAISRGIIPATAVAPEAHHITAVERGPLLF
jgi:hypothetical protein